MKQIVLMALLAVGSFGGTVVIENSVENPHSIISKTIHNASFGPQSYLCDDSLLTFQHT